MRNFRSLFSPLASLSMIDAAPLRPTEPDADRIRSVSSEMWGAPMSLTVELVDGFYTRTAPRIQPLRNLVLPMRCPIYPVHTVAVDYARHTPWDFASPDGEAIPMSSSKNVSPSRVADRRRRNKAARKARTRARKSLY